MAVYEYKGIDAAGKAVAGIIDADNPKVARLRLRKQGMFPTDLHEQAKGGSSTKGTGLNVEIDLAQYFQRVTSRDVATLTHQMATLLGAAVPVVESLTALVEQVEKPKLKVTLSQIKEKVNEGSTLADAMAEHPKVFNALYVHMIRAGERAGALEIVLVRLAEFTESQVKLQGKVQSALAYPILMSGVGGLILTGLFVGVIPRLRRLFDSMDGALPLITQVVFFIADFFMAWWWALGLAFIGIVVWFRRWVTTEEGHTRFDRLKLRVPVFGRIFRLIAISRFCRTLATLLVSGVPIVTALKIVRNVVGNETIALAIDAATSNIQEGQSISVPLKQSGEFPPIVTHMISIGEKTGELEGMLTSVARAYDTEVEQVTDGLTSLLEPLMILVMGGIVGLIAVSILLPMLNLSSLAS